MKKQNVDRYFKGMNQDSSPVDQGKQSYRYALNAINETNEGDQLFISNENSNSLCGDLPQGFFPIGSVYTENNSTIVFSVNPDTNESEIGIIDFKCDYTSYVRSSCLNFSINYQIDATYRVRRGCDRTVYWADGLNPIRYFNLDSPYTFYTQAYIDYLENPVGEFTDEIWECELFSLFPGYTIPCIADVNVITGGVLKAGSYNIGIQYLTEDFNPTNWILSSQTINIYHDELDSSFLGIEGSSNYENDQLGGRVGTTTKALQVRVENLDPRFTYYKLAFIEATGFSGNITKILVSSEISITQNEYVYTGELSGFTEISEAEFKIGKLDIETADHIEQLENRLLIANIKGKQVNFCDFQKYASKIHTRYVVKEVEIQNQLQKGNSKNPLTPFDSLGFMGGEVYAFGIVYVFKDGYESPAYHIPGTAKNQRWNWNTETCEVVDDDSPIVTWDINIEHLVPFVDQAAYNALPDNQKIEKWRVKETAIKVDADEGHMAYWQSMISTYPDIRNCSGDDYWGVDACGNPLVGTPIRHHRFPSRTLEPHISISSTYDTNSKLILNISLNEGKTFPAPTVTINIDYDYNGVPQSTYTLVFDANDLPIINLTVDEQPGDTSLFSNIVISGDITTYTTELSYSTDVVNSSTIYNDGSVARILGVQFDNIEYPHPDIVGHYFVRADRDAINRTILDKGIVGRMREKDLNPFNYLTFSYFTRHNNSQNSAWLFTPRFLFNRDALSPEYLKIEGFFSFAGKTLGSEVYDGIGGIIKETDTIIEHRTQRYSSFGNIPLYTDRNIAKEKTRILDGLSYDDNYISSRRTYNLSHTNRVQVFTSTSSNPIPYDNNNIFFASLRVDRNVHSDLESIKYYRMHNCMIQGNIPVRIFGGDTYIFHSPMSNTLFREFFKSALGAILTAVVIVAAAVASIFTAGAVGAAVAGVAAAIGIAASATTIATAIVVASIVAAAIGVTSTLVNAAIKAYAETNLDEMAEDAELDNLRVKASSFVAYANEHITGIYGESEVNMDLRQSEYHICGAFYKYGEYIGDYFRQKIMFFDEKEEKWYAKTITCPEIYHINKDFLRENRESIYFPLSKSYDCCSDCLEIHPNRIHYSEQSFQEEKEDVYRIFLSNNYRDIEAEHGGITDLFRKNNSLFIHTAECLWQLPQNVQERVTGEVTSFLGTGEYFSIPPRKVLDTRLGSAGTTNKWATNKNPFGVFFVNELENSVYVLSGSEGIKDINGTMSNWFAENLKPYFELQFKSLTNQDFPFRNNNASPYGVGITSVYDERHKRIIFTKKDYLILPQYANQFIILDPTVTLVSNRLFFDPTTGRFGFSNDAITWDWILPTNPNYFENKSFTISYSLLTNSWVSFHSYLPNYYIETKSDFYSFIDNNIWLHNTPGNYQRFYDVLYPHIFEYVSLSNPLTTRLWDDITMQTVAGKFNASMNEYLDVKDITFNFITVYNSRQCSGELQMVNKDTQPNEEDYLLQQITDQSGIILLSRNERNWNVNDLRDYVDNYLEPMFRKDWDSIKNLFPIDKVVNSSVINFNKDWYDLELFRDKYLIVRLKFANFDDIKLTTNYNLETEQDSIR